MIILKEDQGKNKGKSLKSKRDDLANEIYGRAYSLLCSRQQKAVDDRLAMEEK
ncbi:MAG: hypothetical protein PHG66_05205 [Candidatus Colwellbacteria bacterium]|nr:hypothetical protein [Candidatus Colwellbacteria bacterium]